MKEQNNVSRRMLVRSSVLGLIAASVPNILFAKHIQSFNTDSEINEAAVHDRYPAIQLSIAAEVVGVSHFNLERLKQLVDPRPELARAIWDWNFGDWETAIGAASHVGRRDIAEYLISKGAVPDIFTYAMLGKYEAVKAMIEAKPGVQKSSGPHGISLLQHAKTGLQVDGADKSQSQQLIDYLESLGDANGKQYLPMEEAEKTKYIGDYKYGDGKEDGFTIKLNMRKAISLGKLGQTGGALLRLGENEFTYQGAPSVIIKFEVENNVVRSLTITEPGLTLMAKKI